MEALLSAPRRSPAVPNKSGTKALYTETTHNYQDHRSTTRIWVLDLKSRQRSLFSEDPSVRDIIWAGIDDEVLWTQQGEHGKIDFWFGDATSSSRPYVAGSTDLAAKLVKATRLDNEYIGALIMAPYPPGGELSKGNPSTGRVFASMPIIGFDRFPAPAKNSLFYICFSRNRSDSTAQRYEVALATPQPVDLLRGKGLEFEPYTGVVPAGPVNCDISPHGIAFVGVRQGASLPQVWTSEVFFLPIPHLKDHGLPLPQVISTESATGKCALPAFSLAGTSLAFLREADGSIFLSTNTIQLVDDVALALSARYIALDLQDDPSWLCSPETLRWSSDKDHLYFLAPRRGKQRAFKASLTTLKAPVDIALPFDASVLDVYDCSQSKPNLSVVVTVATFTDPPNFYVGSSDTDYVRMLDDRTVLATGGQADKHRALTTSSNSQISEIWFKGSLGFDVHAWVIKPSYARADSSFPLCILIHGGPFASWQNTWFLRWHAVTFAERGYTVVLPDITGSIGYSSELKNFVFGDMPGHAYRDLELCFDYIATNIPVADTTRAVALGGSWGGYMIYWLAGQPLGRKFKALVAHHGIFGLYHLYGTDVPASWGRLVGGKNTDPFDLEAVFHKSDPARFAKNWVTPILIIHSPNDYRTPITMGVAAFQTLQLKGIESEFLTFSDEGHFMSKPENLKVWYETIFSWIDKFSSAEQA